MKNLFEEKPRWPGAPKICIATNLLAFETRSAMKTFLEKNGPGCPVYFDFKCNACGCYHSDTGAPDSGSTGKNSKLTASEKAERKQKYRRFIGNGNE